MRSRRVVLLVIGVLAAVAVIVGVVAVAGAKSTPLAPITASQLMAKMSRSQGSARSISGDVSWNNGLFGNLTVGGSTFGLPAQNPLLSSGSGRVWLSQGGVRLESQGSGGDQVVVANANTHSAWVYDYAANTARHIIVTGAPAGTATPMPATSAPAFTPAMASTLLQRLAPLGSVTMAGQTTVAGRDAYVLKFTPASATTAIGSVQVAVDGSTSVPLRLQVFAKGASSPVLQAGFDSVSFGAVNGSRFTFTPPAGTKVTTRSVNAAKMHTRMQARGTMLKARVRKALVGGTVLHAILNQARAQKLVPFKLATAGSSAEPFRFAVVFKHGMPVTALGTPALNLSGMSGMSGMGGMSAMGGSGATGATAAATSGPAVVQVYGSGLGSIVLVQMPASGRVQGQLGQLGSLFNSARVGSQKAAVISTSLGGVAIWRQGTTTVVAAGLVPAAGLKAFASSVH
jgi:outer membrane lipoprotein-sorting protein